MRFSFLIPLGPRIRSLEALKQKRRNKTGSNRAYLFRCQVSIRGEIEKSILGDDIELSAVFIRFLLSVIFKSQQ
jgi:hypothetical protein